MTGRPARVEGNGPPVVLLHSAVADHGMWDEVANAIAGAYTVIRYDLRGFGASPAPTVGFRHVDDLVAVLDQVGISAAAVVGERLGQVRAPILVGVGDQDVPDFVAIAERLVAGIPDARLVRFPGAGHLIPLEQPDGVADHLRRFLAG